MTDPLPRDWGLCPVLFTVFGFPIEAYSVFLLLAFAVAGTLYLFHLRRRSGVSDQAIYVFAAAIVGGALGAKLPMLIANWHAVSSAQTSWLLTGKTIIGGLLGGTVSVMLTKRWLGIKERLGNAIAPAVALGMAIGRIGCLCRGCCFGQPTSLPWGVDFGDGIRRHPTQMYEAFFDLALLALLLWLHKRITKPGVLFGVLLLSYFPFRFIIEFIRVEPKVFLGLTAFQIVAGLGIIFVWAKYFLVKPSSVEDKINAQE